MRILHVGNGNLIHAGARYYDVGRKLTNGLTRNGHDVYFFSDRDTARSGNIFRSRKLGRRYCNRMFIDTCYNYRPDLILYGLADIIEGESLRKVREFLPHTKMAQFHVDAMFCPSTKKSVQAKLPWVDATFITTAGRILSQFHTAHGKVAFIPNPVDPSVDFPRCHERSDQPNDVFWATRADRGGTYPGNPRTELVLSLERSGRVKVDYHGMNGKPELFSGGYYEAIAQSKMGLNISAIRAYIHSPRASDEELYLYSSDRVSHYMGSGLLTFTTRDNRLEELFKEDRELVFFSTPEELLEKVLHYKGADESRKAVAAAGWRKVHEHFNCQLVAQFILDVTFRNRLSHDYVWPVETY